MARGLARRLLNWYAARARDFPWRRTRDPYAIWVSEIMLQQTRAEAALPFYRRWMERFPDIGALAAAPQQEVLRLWEGLGYYARARNLHRAARRLVAEQGGSLPTTAAELERLPGIGRYAAAAIAAIAFDADAIALDGNLRRVLSRLFDLTLDPRSPEGERRLRAGAMAMLPRGKASAFNQALMDLGATICTPRSPDCGRCPIREGCAAWKRGVQEARPIRRGRPPGRYHQAAAGILIRDGRVLLGRRPEGKLLGGLWEFPGGKREPRETLEQCLRRELREELGVRVRVGKELGSFSTQYTHYAITVHAFACSLRSGAPRPLDHTALRWVHIAALGQRPMGKVDRAIARMLQARLDKPERTRKAIRKRRAGSITPGGRSTRRTRERPTRRDRSASGG